MPREKLIDIIRARPATPKAGSLRARIAVQVRWDEIVETLDAGFPLSWIWQTLQEADGVSFGLRTFRAEVARQRERHSLRAPSPSAPAPDHSPSPHKLADSAAEASPANASIGDATPHPAPQPSLSAAPEPASKHPLPKDAKYFRPLTPEERIERRERAKESIARREAAETKTNEGDPQ